jgi:predicted Kef-type K+ transport protein
MELVIATVGLSLGILRTQTYAMVVLIAVLTSIMAAPLLRFCVERASSRSRVTTELAPVPRA